MARRGNNEGTIYHRPDGRWMASITLGKDDAGRQKRRSYYGRTRAEVAAKLERALNEVRTGTYSEPTQMTVGQWLDIWLAEYVRPSVRPGTWQSYESTIRVHIKPAIGGVLLRSLQPAHVQRMVNGIFEARKAAGSTNPARLANLAHAVLHSALKQAMVNGLVNRNAADGARKAKMTEKPPRVLTVEEQTALLEVAAKDRLGSMVAVMLGTGLRLGEAIALRWDDVDLQRRTIRVNQAATRVSMPDSESRTKVLIQEPKTASGRRSIPLAESTLATLQQWRRQQAEERLRMGQTWKDTGLVFTTGIGTMIGRRNFERKLAELSRKASLTRINPHALRHTCATRMLEAGVPAKVVQEILGHSTVAMTLDTYSHVLPDLKRSAADAIDIFLRPKDTAKSR